MTADADDEPTALAPDDAFAVVGNETRVDILKALGRADSPLSFSELRERVGMRDSGQFNYHLDKLVGHFLEETDDGYALRQAGRRVIEAVLSGAVTDAPVLERTRIDSPCALCGASVEVAYRQERLELYCPECGGTRGGESQTVAGWADAETDILGYLHLPPAGIRDREPVEIHQTAQVWSMTEAMTVARGVCPRCSAVLDSAVHVCEDHDATGGRCDTCDQRFRVTFQHRCTNCVFDLEAPSGSYLLGSVDVMEFMIAHGVDPLAPEAFHLHALEETVRSVDPFEARFTLTADGDALTVTVGDDLSVVDVTRRDAPESV